MQESDKNGPSEPNPDIPEAEISSAASRSPSIDAQLNENGHENALSGREIAVPEGVAASGSLERLVETARDYAKQATAENTNTAYKQD